MKTGPHGPTAASGVRGQSSAWRPPEHDLRAPRVGTEDVSFPLHALCALRARWPLTRPDHVAALSCHVGSGLRPDLQHCGDAFGRASSPEVTGNAQSGGPVLAKPCNDVTPGRASSSCLSREWAARMALGTGAGAPKGWPKGGRRGQWGPPDL